MAFFRSPSARVAGLSAPVRGALLMTGAAVGFAAMTGIIRHVSAEMHPFQIAFFRNFFALLVMLPWAVGAGLAGISTRRLSVHVWRAVIGLAAMLCWFSALSLLPLAQAVALNFTTPLFATAGAALFLGEVVRVRRWTATAVGFLGVLVIVRPGAEEVSLAALLPVAAAFAMAISVLVVKSLSRTEQPAAIVFYMTLLMTPLSLVPALTVWQMPSWSALGWMGLVGLTANGAHLLLTRAYRIADASAVLPFDYARLPFTAAIGYVAFAEVPDLWTWVGAAVIAAATFYIAHREAAQARRRGTEPRTPSPAP
jgi:drug/metabolite transporter (DMT)-like permease